MKCFGILPMAGKGSRLQPLPFSKELYPVVSNGRHFAISEYSIRAMLKANVDELKLVVNPNKMDIAKYYAEFEENISISFFSSPSLPESCLYPVSGLHDDDMCLFGLPDTLFSPNDAYIKIRKELEKGADICLGLFKVENADKYDSVKLDRNNRVLRVRVKQSPPYSEWIWGIWGARVSTLRQLALVIKKQRPRSGKEKLLGVGFDRLARKQAVDFRAVKIGEDYFDVGTMDAVVKVSKVLDKFSF